MARAASSSCRLTAGQSRARMLRRSPACPVTVGPMTPATGRCARRSASAAASSRPIPRTSCARRPTGARASPRASSPSPTPSSPVSTRPIASRSPAPTSRAMCIRSSAGSPTRSGLMRASTTPTAGAPPVTGRHRQCSASSRTGQRPTAPGVAGYSRASATPTTQIWSQISYPLSTATRSPSRPISSSPASGWPSPRFSTPICAPGQRATSPSPTSPRRPASRICP